MNPQIPAQSSSQVPDPVGPNFTIESMREIATRHNAISFIERMPTDATDSGYMLNPDDSKMQFGVSGYRVGDISLTHSIASFYPRELTTQQDSVYIYNDVTDIELPYQIPHVLVFPKVKEGIIASMMQTNAPIFSKKVAARIELEGDFSQFIDAYSPPEEDVHVFTYLAPNIMELLLQLGPDFTVEFIDNHIYVYFMKNSATAIAASEGQNTYITEQVHEQILQTGLAISNKLVRASRPLNQTYKPTKRMPRPTVSAILTPSLLPIAIAFVLSFLAQAILPFISYANDKNFAYLPAFAITIIIAVTIGIYVQRYLKHTRILKRYNQLYSTS